MGSTGEDILTPRALAIPSGAFAATPPSCPGMITLSGGVLYFISGGSVAYINAT